MIQKKICMLGSFGVGKTSLVARFVQGIFSAKYLSTVGVKIDKREMKVGDQDVLLMLWDLAGEDSRSQVQTSYLKGAAGYFLVCRRHLVRIAGDGEEHSQASAWKRSAKFRSC